MSDRTSLAERVAAGLGGWLQLQAAQGLQDLHGEDVAQFTLVQILGNFHQWRVTASAKPPNWSKSKKHRVDLALRTWPKKSKGQSKNSGGKSKPKKSWYGVIEVKWPGTATDRRAERRRLLRDVLRVVSVKTHGEPNAAFVVLGASQKSIAQLFDKKHKTNATREQEREWIGKLLSRDPEHPDGALDAADIDTFDPKWRDYVPADPQLKVNNRIEATLVASREAHVGDEVVGAVFVWQCHNGRGAPRKMPKVSA